MKIVVFTAATKNYAYALRESMLSVKRALAYADYTHVVATDRSGVTKEIIKSTGIDAKIIEIDCDDSEEKYKNKSQLIISDLQQACLDEAREIGADLCWSVESDILVHQSSFSSLKWVLECPEPRYDIAAATYFNGAFLCGRGTPIRQICEDYTESERKIPEELEEKLAKKRKEIDSDGAKKELMDEMEKLQEELRACPPSGNVFELNAKSWRRRGWLENAYPGAAVFGATLPTDWCGLGCTLLTKKALLHSNFDGYDGGGTQDLYLVWNKWHPAGLMIGCNVSVPAIHVKREAGQNIAWVPFFSSIENERETYGHLRVSKRKFLKS